MIAPLATDWAEMERLFWVNTLVRVEKIRTPKTVPTIVPRPPMRSVPPTTTAAIASSSYSCPWVDEPAVGGNPEAARLAGIKVNRHTMYLYALAGLTAGIAAVMMLARTTAGSSTHGQLY